MLIKQTCSVIALAEKNFASILDEAHVLTYK